jgi:hypothetical protein
MCQLRTIVAKKHVRGLDTVKDPSSSLKSSPNIDWEPTVKQALFKVLEIATINNQNPLR